MAHSDAMQTKREKPHGLEVLANLCFCLGLGGFMNGTLLWEATSTGRFLEAALIAGTTVFAMALMGSAMVAMKRAIETPGA